MMAGKPTSSSQLMKMHLTNPILFHDETLNKLGIEGNLLNMIKAVCEKFTAKITFNSDN